MAEQLEVLIAIQRQILDCRQVAAELPPKWAEVFYRIADQIEMRARQVDLDQSE